jgi:Lar family restriction alleviation protein
MTNDRDGREELKPCPFCGSTEIAKDETNMNGVYIDSFVQCLNCAAAIVYKSGRTAPSEAWNQRPAPEGRDFKTRLRTIVDEFNADDEKASAAQLVEMLEVEGLI